MKKFIKYPLSVKADTALHHATKKELDNETRKLGKLTQDIDKTLLRTYIAWQREEGNTIEDLKEYEDPFYLNDDGWRTAVADYIIEDLPFVETEGISAVDYEFSDDGFYIYLDIGTSSFVLDTWYSFGRYDVERV